MNNKVTKHKLSQETQQLIEQRMALSRDRTHNKETILQMNKTIRKKVRADNRKYKNLRIRETLEEYKSLK